MTPYLVGVAGGSGSGKTTFCRMLFDAAPHGAVVIIEHDYYYRCLAHIPQRERYEANFDHPDSLETELLVAQLKMLKAGLAIDAPQYDYASSSRVPRTKRIDPHPIVLVDGILVLADKRLRELFDLRVFVDAPDDLRYQRRLRRDVAHRQFTAEQVYAQYHATVKPMHDEFVAPSREASDVIVHGGVHFGPAIEMFTSLVREKVQAARDHDCVVAAELARS